MRINSLKQKLNRGERVLGALFEFNNAELVEMFGRLGFDFVFIDGQHSGLTIETGRELIRAADVSGMTSLVRVPRLEASVILEYLDSGAGGIIVPNITTRAEVDEAVSYVRYPPVGKRGGFGRSRAAEFGATMSSADYFRAINDEILFVPLIEDEAALANLDQICSAPGVDMVLIGPGDLALSMGIPGGWTAGPVQEAVERIRAAGVAADKPVLTLATDISDAKRLYEQGFQAVQVSVAALLTGATRRLFKEVGRS